MKTKLLLIEDELDLADNIKNILELNEFDVTTARDGEAGIKLAKQIVPDIIISDILMPSKTGYEVLEELSRDEKTSHIPFIFLTAKVEHKDLRKGMELGADDYIFKPFQSKELISAVNARLKRANLIKGKESDENLENVNRYKQDDNIILSINKNTSIIKVNRILYIIAERQYSKVVITDGKNVLLRKSLLYWESILPTNLFIRIHRNTIVNVQEVNSISKKSDGNYKAIMKSGRIEFEISRRYMKKIRDLFVV
jgi:DNA-binding LytR/AlgR family response regulator